MYIEQGLVSLSPLDIVHRNFAEGLTYVRRVGVDLLHCHAPYIKLPYIYQSTIGPSNVVNTAGMCGAGVQNHPAVTCGKALHPPF